VSANPPNFKFPGMNLPGETGQAIRLLFEGLRDSQAGLTALNDKHTSVAQTVNNIQGGGGGTSTITRSFLRSTLAAWLVNKQTGAAYTITDDDYGSVIEVNSAVPFTLTLDNVVIVPYGFFVLNVGTATVTMAPVSGTLNATTVPAAHSAVVFFDSVNWWSIIIPSIGPNTIAKVTHDWLDSYDAATGNFTQSQPASTDLSDSAALERVANKDVANGYAGLDANVKLKMTEWPISYGNMYVYNGAIAITITVIDTFVMVPSGLSGGTLHGFTFQNARELKTAVAGVYQVTWSMSVHAGLAAQEVEGAMMLNSTAQTFTAAHAETITLGRPMTVSGSGIVSLAVNDLIQVAVANHTGTNNLTVDHVTLSIVQVG
jgi:hypothetical protein